MRVNNRVNKANVVPLAGDEIAGRDIPVAEIVYLGGAASVVAGTADLRLAGTIAANAFAPTYN